MRTLIYTLLLITLTSDAFAYRERRFVFHDHHDCAAQRIHELMNGGLNAEDFTLIGQDFRLFERGSLSYEGPTGDTYELSVEPVNSTWDHPCIIATTFVCIHLHKYFTIDTSEQHALLHVYSSDTIDIFVAKLMDANALPAFDIEMTRHLIQTADNDKENKQAEPSTEIESPDPNALPDPRLFFELPGPSLRQSRILKDRWPENRLR